MIMFSGPALIQLHFKNMVLILGEKKELEREFEGDVLFNIDAGWYMKTASGRVGYHDYV